MIIKILESHPNLKIDRKFTEGEKKFILLLEEDILLEETLQLVRKLASLPYKGFDVYTEFEKYKALSDEQHKYIFKYASYLMQAYEKLPKHWIHFFKDLILFNLAIPSGSPIEIKYEDQKVVITINEAMTQKEFSYLLRGRRYIIDPMLKLLPSIPATKMKREKINMMKSILEVKRNMPGKKTDQDIAVNLIDQGRTDPDDKIDGIFQGSSLGVLRNRFEKVIKGTLQLEKRKYINKLINEGIKKHNLELIKSDRDVSKK